MFSGSISRVLPLGPRSESLWALLAVAVLTALNLLGIRVASSLQKHLVILILAGLLIISTAGFAGNLHLAALPAQAFQNRPQPGELGTALVFVLLTFGGWNEAATMSAELKGGRRAITAVLLLSLGLITGLYLLVNLALLSALGISDLARSSGAAVDVLARALGPGAELAVVLLIGAAALSSINATMVMGARATHALAQDWRMLGVLGGWQSERHTPTGSVLLQSLISATLILIAAVQPDGFSAVVEYTAPLFWAFLSLIALSVIILRRQNRTGPKITFRTPLYPLLPLLFFAACVYLTISSLRYAAANQGGFISLVVLGSGAAALFALRHRQRRVAVMPEQPGAP